MKQLEFFKRKRVDVSFKYDPKNEGGFVELMINNPDVFTSIQHLQVVHNMPEITSERLNEKAEAALNLTNAPNLPLVLQNQDLMNILLGLYFDADTSDEHDHELCERIIKRLHQQDTGYYGESKQQLAQALTGVRIIDTLVWANVISLSSLILLIHSGMKVMRLSEDEHMLITGLAGLFVFLMYMRSVLEFPVRRFEIGAFSGAREIIEEERRHARHEIQGQLPYIPVHMQQNNDEHMDEHLNEARSLGLG